MTMMRRLILCGAGLLAIGACDDDGTGPEDDRPYEVWLVDQSNSRGQTFGGAIHIFDGAQLEAAPGTTPSAAVIDLGAATSSMCNTQTGANPVRPHMLFFNAAGTHAVLSFVASGHVVVFSTTTRAPIACLRTSAGAGGVRQAHAAFPSPDGAYVLVANQNGKLLERIDANFSTNTFTLNTAATLNLATCTTPTGAACEGAATRPDNAPICPVLDRTGALSFVTLRGGGLFVVDPRSTPMRIVGEYDRATVHGNGCGGAQVGDNIYINSGGGTAANLTEFDVYRFPNTGYGGSTIRVNTPAPLVLFSDDAGDRDSHGMIAAGDGRYLWVADRRGNVMEVFDLQSSARLSAVNLTGSLTSDPAPDLMGLSPNGELMFVSLRGPTPLTGDPHVATGTTPGVAVVELRDGGRTGAVRAVVRITKLEGTVETADPHGIAVRTK
jgi:hypothetical protein